MAPDKTCPCCGSKDVVTTEQDRSADVPFGPTIPYKSITDTCNGCHESGDFLKLNDQPITEAREASAKASIAIMLENLKTQGCSRPYIERALSLPMGTLTTWEQAGTSAAQLALLRMITTFPWLIEVADSRW